MTRPVDRAGHLRDTELVDLLDGSLDDRRIPHVEGCRECRARADDLRAVLRSAADVDVPEPPAHFWEAFSARVRGAVAEEPPPRRRMWTALAPSPVRWAALAATVVVAVSVSVWRSLDPMSSTPTSSGAPVTAAIPAPAGSALGDETFADIESDEAWALVRSVAEGVDLAGMADAGISLGPGSADGMAARLTETERQELARLIEEAIHRRPTSESSL